MCQLSDNQITFILYVHGHETENRFFPPQTVNELDQHAGSHCQAAIMHKRFGLELNVVKAGSNA